VAAVDLFDVVGEADRLDDRALLQGLIRVTESQSGVAGADILVWGQRAEIAFLDHDRA
jgi:hypothetical protein